MWRLHGRSSLHSLATWLPLRAGAAVPEWETLLTVGLWADQAQLAAAGSSGRLEWRPGLATARAGGTATAGSQPSRRHRSSTIPSSGNCNNVGSSGGSNGGGGSLTWAQPARTFTTSSSSSSSSSGENSSAPLESSGPSFERLQRAYEEFKGPGASRRAALAKARAQAGAGGTGRRRRQAAQPAAVAVGLLEEEEQIPMPPPPQPVQQQSVQQQQEPVQPQPQPQQQELHGTVNISGSMGSAESASSSEEEDEEEGREEFEDIFEISIVDLEDLGPEGAELGLDFLSPGSHAHSTADGTADSTADSSAAAAAVDEAQQQQQQQRQRLGRPAGLLRLGRPMQPDAEAFLHSKGVDTQAVVATLPFRAAELTLERIQATWALLEEFGILRPAELITARPSVLSIDPEAGLRPKFLATGLRGHALSELFAAHPSIHYANPDGFRETLAFLEGHILAAARAGLLPPDTSFAQQLASKPRQWAAVLPNSRGHVESVLAVLRVKLGFTKAQCGACIAGFPMSISHSSSTLATLCDFYVSVLGKRAAAELLLSTPLLLRASQGLLSSNMRYMRQGLGWSEQEVCHFLQEQPVTFGFHLQGPLMQHLLKECHSVLGIPPSDMLRLHTSTLRCSPRQAMPRCAFLQRAGKLGMLKTPRFIKDSSQDWAARLSRLGLRWEDWLRFEEEYWEQPAAQKVLAEAAEELAASRKRQGVALSRRVEGQGGGDSSDAGAAASDSSSIEAAGARAAGRGEELGGKQGKKQTVKEVA